MAKLLQKMEDGQLTDIDNVMSKEFIPEFSSLGMLSKPYPFFDGVYATN